SVSHAHICHSTSTPPALTSSSSPHARRSSIERVLITVARGSDDRSTRLSTSRHSTPCRPSIVAAARPAGPPPPTTTRTSITSDISSSPFSSDALSLIGQSVFPRTCCQPKTLRSLAMARRPYEQRARAETAEATRHRILDALYDRLAEAPSKPITVDEIA